MIDEVVVSAIRSVLPDHILIELPGQGSSDLVISHGQRRAMVNWSSAAPIWTVLDRNTGTLLAWGEERNVREATRNALSRLMDPELSRRMAA